MTIHAVAIIKPKPGKIDKVIEAVLPFSEYVKANEPGVLKHQLHRQINVSDGQEVLVYIETYKDMEAVAAHRASEAYKALIARAKEEQLLAAPIESRHLEVVGGFDTRT